MDSSLPSTFSLESCFFVNSAHIRHLMCILELPARCQQKYQAVPPCSPCQDASPRLDHFPLPFLGAPHFPMLLPPLPMWFSDYPVVSVYLRCFWLALLRNSDFDPEHRWCVCEEVTGSLPGERTAVGVCLGDCPACLRFCSHPPIHTIVLSERGLND